MARKWLRNGVLLGAVTFGSVCGSLSPISGAFARGYGDSGNSDNQVPGTIAAAQLPREAVNTLNLIAAGGPYPYEKDGIVFGNRERLLAPHRRGFYHEYTVPTPRARNRGARRIVCGGPLQRTDNCYYSDDHYTSFNRIVE
jgi:ribonuclease T1